MIIPFEGVQASDKRLGGKALGLGLLSKSGFPVPPGIVLDMAPSEATWKEVLDWWDTNGRKPLAVRSSASAEDTTETSFAGQNITCLNVEDEDTLRGAIEKCFASLHRENSQAYREFFAQKEAGSMNVIIQLMVQPRYSGVFFSRDPRKSSGWLLEVVEGLGERLVSGHVTPGRRLQNGESSRLPSGFSDRHIDQVTKAGSGVAQSLGYDVDMEWSFDSEDKFFVLQARPITTAVSEDADQVIERELTRLKKTHRSDCAWDGQTFSEFKGLPKPLTFSLWEKAFSPGHAFDKALHDLGYRSFPRSRLHPQLNRCESILESVFGRAFINLDKLSALYYGESPYRINLRPRPHAVFSWSKINFSSLLNFPTGTWNMLRVGWTLATQRRSMHRECLTQLARFRGEIERAAGDSKQASPTIENLQNKLRDEVNLFTSEVLYWPLVLIVLTEATTQSLLQLLSGVMAPSEALRKIRDWTGRGLHTVTFDMQRDFAEACGIPELQLGFLARYGHRGPGEMELAQPRWREIGERAFTQKTAGRIFVDHAAEIESEIRSLDNFRRDMILEEWSLLRELLETRELWKMELLKPYARIRSLALAMGEGLGIGHDVFWLNVSELLDSTDLESPAKRSDLASAIDLRKKEGRAFQTVSLPDQVSLSELRRLIDDSDGPLASQLDGEALSSGMAFGEVRFVDDPLAVNLSEWPESVILVAANTDPGWTALFARSKGIVVEHGGVLSHCAIISREMGIPAVGGIVGVEKKLANGEKIWVDGNHGRVIRDDN